MNTSLSSNPLISVIVPIYNVEQFLGDCLDSICRQTYEKLEIILVNDGSTDNSLAIAEKYKKKDHRIVVINQENKGLSGARNAGIDVASGEYLYFVDSDDLLFEDAIFCLLKNILDTNADIAISAYYLLKENKLVRPLLYKSECVEVLDKNNLLEELACCERIQNFAWGKLYKADLFKNIRFPLGKYFEDQFVMMHLFSLCNKGVFVDNPKYIYRFNVNSISRTLTGKKLIDYGEGFVEKLLFYNSSYPEYVPFMLKNGNNILAEIRKRHPVISSKELKKIYKNLNNYLFSNVKNTLTKILKTPFLSSICLMLAKKDAFKNLASKIVFKGNKSTFTLLARTKPKAVFYFGSPEYDNIGDHAIFIASKQFFHKYFCDYDFISYTETQIANNLRRITKQIKKDDLVVIQGGGNIGSVYTQEKLRRKILKYCKKTQTFVMPASIHFSNDRKGMSELKKSARTYNSCSRLTIILRDIYSFDFAKKHFKCTLLHYPDIVFSLSQKYDFNQSKGEQPLLCMRDDCESKMSFDDKQKLYRMILSNSKFFVSDDTSTGYLIPTQHSETEFEKMLNIFNNSSFIVTDRLHGMIFAYLLNKKCFVFSNYDKKIEGAFQWIKESKNIIFLGDIDLSQNILNKCLDASSIKEDNTKLLNFFNQMATEMKEIIKNGHN